MEADTTRMCTNTKDHNCQKPEEAGGGVGSSEPPEGTNLAGTLILDVWPPELWDNKFLLFQATQFLMSATGG